ncbi:MAG: SGNH/GDSL hydrolase family protein [Fuerstiella sp.]|nr:SGNH/GDSL hydrolase family protein [Fuerstiella sp.]MCP4858770.1 SGNH/GDSL hydrolase family protein [Fuerstiella sp.]
MKRPASCSALLILALVLNTAAAEDSFPLKAKRILFLGDSITNSGYYVADIETQLRIQGVNPMPEIVNIGLPSETCSGLSEPDHPFPRPDVHERLDRALAKVKPDVVVVCYGMNDGIYYPFDPDRFQAYQVGINKLIDKVHAAGAKIVLVTPPPFDPTPLMDEKGKLLPAESEKFAWFAIYEDYDNVLQRYGKWILKQADKAEMVIDVHTPVTEFLAEQRRTDPKFHVASDGVHMNEAGHHIMAAAILKAWGVESWEEPASELQRLMKQKEKLLHDSWLSHVGHKRPGVKDGLPLNEATAKARELNARIEPLIKEARQPGASQCSVPTRSD